MCAKDVPPVLLHRISKQQILKSKFNNINKSLLFHHGHFKNRLKKKNDCGSRNAVTTYSTGWCHFLDPGHQLYPPLHLPVTVHVETVGKSLSNVLVLI